MSAGAPSIVVLGMAGRAPFAGVAWQLAHYVEGFRRLGARVAYLEDTGDWPYDADADAISADPGFTLHHLGALLDRCGLPDAWAYRAASRDGELLGPAAARVPELLAGADALVNLCGATLLREEHARVPVRIYLETDPVLPQIEVAQGRAFTIELLGAHTHHFSFVENLGQPDCGVPRGRFAYRATRQPVVLDWWSAPGDDGAPADACFTTVASFRQSGKDVVWNGEPYAWSKHHEFLKLLDLPRRSGRRLALALAAADAADVALLETHGWGVRDGLRLSRDLDPYREFIRGSRGEFTVAKDQNVRLRSGWFSDRSATYLAAGRPVVTQDTGFGRALPTGRGLFAFRSAEDVLAALDAIDSDYAGHCRAARELAAEHFAAEKVLARLLREAGL